MFCFFNVVTDASTTTQKLLEQIAFPSNMGASLIPWLQSWSHEQRAELKELIERNVEADHPQLLKHIQNMFVPPQPGRRKVVRHDPITPQAQRAQELLKDKVSKSL